MPQTSAGWFQLLISLLSIGVDVCAFVRMRMPVGLTEDLSLGMPEYAFILVVCTGLLIAVNWSIVRRVYRWREERKPETKFHKMHSTIVEVTESLARAMEKISALPDILIEIPRIVDLAISFQELGIKKLPTLSRTNSSFFSLDWYNFLTGLAVYSKRRQLDCAIEYSEHYKGTQIEGDGPFIPSKT